MKAQRILITAGLACATAQFVLAGPPPQPKIIPPPPPPVIANPVPPPPPADAATAAAAGQPQFVYNQQPLASRPILVSAEQAKSVIERFKAAYPKMGKPRLLLYVNRELVDEQSGMKLAARSQRTETSTAQLDSHFQPDPSAPKPGTNSPTVVTVGNVTINGGIQSGDGLLAPGKGKIAANSQKANQEDSYKFIERPQGTLADRQTVRDVERLFGRPLRMANASIADQRVATQLIPGNPLKSFDNTADSEQARKDREALGKVADVVIEILISSRNLTLAEVSGDHTYAVPDIQATAIRLTDARVLGQATAADIIGIDRYAGRVVKNFDVREIAEATALALMEDMLVGQE